LKDQGKQNQLSENIKQLMTEYIADEIVKLIKNKKSQWTLDQIKKKK
jgi:predicted naringenin-chalcone synthase